MRMLPTTSQLLINCTAAATKDAVGFVFLPQQSKQWSYLWMREVPIASQVEWRHSWWRHVVCVVSPRQYEGSGIFGNSDWCNSTSCFDQLMWPKIIENIIFRHSHPSPFKQDIFICQRVSNFDLWFQYFQLSSMTWKLQSVKYSMFIRHFSLIKTVFSYQRSTELRCNFLC